MPEHLSETISAVKNGSQPAFRRLVEEYQSYAFALAFRIVCNEEDARDVVQESFIKIWKGIGQYDEKVKFTTWMYKIITHSAIDKYRKQSRRINLSLDNITSTQFASLDDDPETMLNNKELARLIRLISDGLPEKQRLVFILRDLDGMGTQEVCEILKINETSVKSNLYHARRSVRETLKKLVGNRKAEADEL